MSDQTAFLSITALCALPLAPALAAAGMPALAAALNLAAPKRVKVFRDKFGQQAATFALLTGLVSFLALIGGAAFLALRLPDVALFWMGRPLPGLLLGGSLLLAAGLALFYRASWHALADKRGAHALLGVLSGVFGLAFGYLGLVSLRHFLLSPSTPVAEAAFFLPEKASAVWLYSPLAAALCLCAAGALVACYLIRRRDRDDFGRDYYNYTLRLAAKAALAGGLPALGLLTFVALRFWEAVRDTPLRQGFFWSEAVAAGSWLLSCLLWALVVAGKNPLRMKAHLVSAAAFFVAGLCAMVCGLALFHLG